jgi:hypothetical protein
MWKGQRSKDFKSPYLFPSPFSPTRQTSGDGSRICHMIKHYILSLNPTAKHDWDRCILRDPLTAKRPDLAKLVAEAVGADTGSYLVSVNIEVKVLEQTTVVQTEQLSLNVSDMNEKPQLREVA